MKKKLFFSIASIGTALMTISVLGFGDSMEAKADVTTGWTCVNGARAVAAITGGVKLTTDAWGVQHQKDDAFYLNGASFTFGNEGSAGGQGQGFFFGSSSATGFGYTGPVFMMAHAKYGSQLRLLATANHDHDSTTSYWYTSTEAATPGCGGQASPQIVGNSTAEGSDVLNYKFEKINASWWKVEIKEVSASTIWGDTANYVKDQESGLATVTLYLKNSDMTVAEDSTCYLEVVGLSGYVNVTNFVNGTKWQAQTGPDKDTAKSTVNAAFNGLNKFEYSSSVYQGLADDLATAITAIDAATTQTDVDAIVSDYQTKVTNAAKLEYTAITDDFMVCTYGACAERTVKKNAETNRIKLVTDAWPVTYTSGKKYALDGLTMVFGTYNTASASPSGFFFTQSATPTTGSGYETEDSAVVNIWQSRWGGQSRLAVVSSHDEGSAVKCYQDMNGTNTGFGGAGAQQLVLTDKNPTLLKFQFEHVKKAWWALHITSTEWTSISFGTTNYKDNKDGTFTSTVYIKSANLPLDDKGEAYLNVLGMNGNAIIQDFVPGEYKELPEEPATPEEIQVFKDKVNAAAAGYDETYTAMIAEAKDKALNDIDAKTYASEMEPIAETFKESVVAGYRVYLGYSKDLTALDPNANFYACWGAALRSERRGDAGEVLVDLKNEFGTRGEFIRQYDPFNFEMSVNLSDAKNDTVVMFNFDTAAQSYCNSAATKYFHIEFLVRPNNKVHSIVGNTDAHNISITGWDKVNDNTYTGTPLDLGNSGFVNIKFVTDVETSKTTITMNEVSVEVDTSLLNKGEAAPETPVSAYVQVGTMNNNGTYTKVLVSKIEDAASKSYAENLAKNKDAIVAGAQKVADDAVAAYGTFAEAGDEQYKAFEDAYAAGVEQLGKLGLTSYDASYYLGSIIKGLDDKKAEIEADYAGKVDLAKAAVLAIFDDFPEANYREAEVEQITQIKTDTNTALALCASIGACEVLGAEVREQLEALKTAAQYEAEEALAEAKAAACAVLDAELDKASDETITEVAKLIGEGKSAINACETIAQVTDTKALYLGKIDVALHAKDVVSIAVSGAKVEFTVGDTFSTEGLKVQATLKDSSKVDVTDKAIVDSSAVDMASAGTYKVKVTYAGCVVEYTITVKAKVSPEPEPEPKKGGCGSSIIAASAIVSLIAVAGATLVLGKKKED